MNSEKKIVFDFKKSFTINKAIFKKQTHLKEIPIHIEFNHRLVDDEDTFIYSNGIIVRKGCTPEITEINDILIEKLGEFVRKRMKEKLQNELSVDFGVLKKNMRGNMYSSNIVFSVAGMEKQYMIFDKIHRKAHLTILDNPTNSIAYFKVINVILNSLISEDEHTFLFNTSTDLKREYEKIVEDVVLRKFKETRGYKIRCLYDKEFECHFEKNRW